MRPIRAVIVISVCTALSLAGCRKPHPPHAAHTLPPPPPLPVVKAEEVPAPAKTSVVLEKGMVISKVATESYGHEKFAGMLLRFNKITDPARIKAGTVVNTPSIPELFKAEGLDAKYQPAINVLGKAVHDFYEVLPDFRALRLKAAEGTGNGTGGTGSGPNSSTSTSTSPKFIPPAELKQKLEHIADAVASAAAVFAGAEAPHKAPNAAVQQLRQAALQIRGLAAGNPEGGPDNEEGLVGQRLGLGMTNALIWLQQKYQ